MRAKAFLLVTVLLAVTVAPAGSEPVEPTIPFSKTTSLTADRSYTFRFSLWSLAEGGSELSDMAWSEEERIRLAGKKVRHCLGSVEPLDAVDFSQQYWIQLDRKKADGTLVPLGSRTRLNVVPYSVWSREADPGGFTHDLLEAADECAPGDFLIKTASGWVCGDLPGPAAGRITRGGER